MSVAADATPSPADTNAVVEFFRRAKNYGELSRLVSQVATATGEWCGFPMPIPGLTLDIEPKNPWIEKVRAIERDDRRADAPESPFDDIPLPTGYSVVNSWFSWQANARVFIIEKPDGTRCAVKHQHRNLQRVRASVFGLLEASNVWDLETELTAITTLETLVKPHIFEYYAKVGIVIETSKRSGLTYVFRKLLPTLVLTPHKDPKEVRMLCALCLHPIGYYRDTHAGVMCPTDDVIAHLLLMRGAEEMLWKRANQHEPHSPLAGVMI